MTLTRRQLLQAGGVLGLGALAAACTGNANDTSPSSSSSGSGTPRRGGTLRVGALGRPGAITRDPHGNQGNESDLLIISLNFDPITVPGKTEVTAPRLASRWTSSKDLTSWRFQIADGATFHNGKPVTAADVVWSLRRLRGTPAGASRLPGIQAKNITADGTTAVTLLSDYPNAALPLQTRLTTFVLPADTPESQIATAPGTGPFRLVSFANGNAKLVANHDWYGGPVYLDGIEVTMFETAEAMTNAAITGQIDLASNAGALAARTARTRGGVQVVRRPNDLSLPIVMRTADGPFADPRVREAMRLIVDRPAMVTQVLSGYGKIANDVMGTGDPDYDTSLAQRRRDLTKAKQLLTAAKFDTSKTYELVTTEDVAGLAESASLFAVQAADAGVKVKVTKQESGAYYDKTWLKGDFYTTYWGTNDSVLFFAAKTLTSAAGQNETAWHDSAFDAAYRSAIASSDSATRTAALKRLQQIEYDRSGYLLWGMADGVDLAAAKVRNLPTLPGYGRLQLENVWLS